MSLVEVLVAIVLIGVLAAALSAGVLTTMRSSATANSTARATALLTATRATVAQLTYIECGKGELVQRYDQALQDHNANLAEADKLVPSGATDVSIAVVGVDTAGGCVGGEPDTGQQTLTVSVTTQGTTLTGLQVKRGDPFDLRAVISEQYLNPASGDPIGIFLFSAANSFPLSEINRFEWNCGDGSGSAPDTTYLTFSADDPAVECRYPAQSGVGTDYTVTLTVTDIRGKVASTSLDITVDPAGTATPDPVATFTTSPASGEAPLTVTFDPAGSAAGSPESQIVAYEWDFGDAFDPDGRFVTTTDIATTPTYTYTRAGTFMPNLTVVDDLGRRVSTIRTVVANPPVLAPPAASFTVTPPAGVAPQTVAFDASGSEPGDPGRPIVAWEWDFGGGETGTGASTTHQFNAPGSHVVSLTVRDSQGLEDTTTRTVVIDTFTNPGYFWLTSVKPAPGDGIFYFSWVNEGASPGDTLGYEVEIQGLVGCVGFGTQTHYFPAGDPGTAQSGSWVIPGPGSNVCRGSQYQWRMRSERSNPVDGSYWTAPTDWVWFKARTDPYG